MQAHRNHHRNKHPSALPIVFGQAKRGRAPTATIPTIIVLHAIILTYPPVKATEEIPINQSKNKSVMPLPAAEKTLHLLLFTSIKYANGF
jgi:hypothetical protein